MSPVMLKGAVEIMPCKPATETIGHLVRIKLNYSKPTTSSASLVGYRFKGTLVNPACPRFLLENTSTVL